MNATVAQYIKRTAIISLEIVAVLLVILMVVIGLFAWRMTAGPVDVSFAKKYVESALRDNDNNIDVSFGQVMVHWPDIKSSFYLTLKDIKLNDNGKKIAEVDALDVALSRKYLLIGQIKPIQIVLDRPSLHMVRTEQNSIALFIDNDVATLPDDIKPEQSIDRTELVKILDDILMPENENSKTPAFLRQMESLEIKNAQMVIEDHIIGMTWYLPEINFAFARDEAGLIATGSVDLPGGGGVDGASSIQTDIRYNKDDKKFDVRFYVQDFNPHFLSEKIESLAFLKTQYFSVNGDIRFVLSQTLDLETLELLVSSNAGVLALDGIYNDPFRFQSAYLDMTYNHANKFIDIRNLSLTANDTEINIKSPIRFRDDKIAAALTVSIPEIQMDKVPPIWPHELLKGEPAEEWMLEKLSEGSILNMQVNVDLVAQKIPATNAGTEAEWSVEASNVTAEFSAQNMSVNYRAPLRRITEANGKGSMAKDVLTIDVETAKLGVMDVAKSQIVIDHVLEEGVGNANISLNLKGSLHSLFDYIKDEPINKSAADIGIDGGKVKGNADLNVKVSFPTVKDLPVDDVKVSATGTITDAFFPGVVRGLDLTGGPLTLKLADGSVALSGQAKLDGRPVDLKWQEYLESKGKPYAGRIEAKLIADKKLRDHFGIGIDDWVAGAFPIELVFTEYQDDRAVINIKGDLTPAVLMIEPFDYKKPAGAPGTFSCTAVSQGPYMKEIKSLTITTNELDLKDGQLDFKVIKGESVLTGGAMPQVKLNENDLNVSFEIGASDLIKMDIKGAFLDARPFLADKDPAKKSEERDPFIASVAVDRMRTAENRMIEKAKLYIDLDRQGAVNQLEMDAVAGRGEVYLRLKPDHNGYMMLRLEAGDAGAMLRAFDIYENVKGGKLLIEGKAKSVAAKDVLYGKLQLGDFRVIDAPVLARLLGALGPTSIPQLLSGEGIYFTKLESDFDWHIRPDGDLYVVNNGRTSGSSLGLTFEGSIDKRKDLMALKGTVVPISMLNNMVSDIPLIGSLLAGGKNSALLAATYKIEGPAKNPTVSVNPLAALAPGFLRKLLFED